MREAWDHEDEEIRKKWREALRKEIRDMIRRGVWRHKSKKSVLHNRRLVGNKWVFKLKNNGRFRARLVALGYSQVPGQDYSENVAPVINNVTLRVVLLIGILKK